MAKKSKDKQAKPIKDLKPGEDTSESVKGGLVPPGPQLYDARGLAKKLTKALTPDHTTPPIN